MMDAERTSTDERVAAAVQTGQAGTKQPGAAAPADALVLIVEDQAANLMLVEAVLRRGGFRTVSAGTAAQALERIREQPPQAILMDLQLPGEDGLSLTRRLRASPETAEIPIIAVTAHALPEYRARAAAAGCDAFITKPIDTRSLAGEIRAVLARRGAS